MEKEWLGVGGEGICRVRRGVIIRLLAMFDNATANITMDYGTLVFLRSKKFCI